jgi:hypothetical protein
MYTQSIFLFAISAILLMFSPAIATFASEKTDNSAKKIENVLDKLEKRLIDKESSPFTEDEDVSPERLTPTKNKKPNSVYNAKSPAKINGQTPSSKNLKEVQIKINEYDNKLDSLESELRKLRAGVYEGSATDNQVMVDIRTGKDAKFVIRTLLTRLDGNNLFNQMDAAGMWMPSKEIPLFFGPLQPGEHRLDVIATIAPLTADGLELPTWRHKSLQQSFAFTVNEGKVRKNVSIELEALKSDSAQPTAKLTEEEQK